MASSCLIVSLSNFFSECCIDGLADHCATFLSGLRGVDFNTAALGDVIVAVNDTTVRRLSDLTDELERNGVGKTVRLTVQRDGRTRTVETEAPHLVSRPRTTKFPSRALQDLQKCCSYKDMTGMSSKTPRG